MLHERAASSPTRFRDDDTDAYIVSPESLERLAHPELQDIRHRPHLDIVVILDFAKESEMNRWRFVSRGEKLLIRRVRHRFKGVAKFDDERIELHRLQSLPIGSIIVTGASQPLERR
jgi:hypothetical protein